MSSPPPSADSSAGELLLRSGVRVHVVGIGGAGMSGLARILLGRGAVVSGSDAHDSAVLPVLRGLGARVDVGHDPSLVDGADVLLVSTAIRADNPEVLAAQRLGLPVLPRAAALGALTSGRRTAAVAGTHGKTTTTSMLTRAVQACGLDPSYAVGGDLEGPASNAHDGADPVFVVEADESDESFLALRPDVAVVTNIEADHLDHFGSLAAVERAFDAFVDRITPGGTLVVCADDAGADRAAVRASRQGRAVVRYGTAPDADLRAAELTMRDGYPSFVPVLAGSALPRLALQVPGEHNARNACAALAAGAALGLRPAGLLAGLAGFGGVRRRLETKGSAAGVRVVDSYAHHPTEVAADLRAARGMAGGGRLVVAFQPHLFSRTAAFAAELGTALGLADEVVVMDVYPARETPVPGVDGGLVAAQVPLPSMSVAYEPRWDDVPEALARRAEPGDLVLTLGAGDVTQIGPLVLDALAHRSAARRLDRR